MAVPGGTFLAVSNAYSGENCAQKLSKKQMLKNGSYTEVKLESSHRLEGDPQEASGLQNCLGYLEIIGISQSFITGLEGLDTI